MRSLVLSSGALVAAFLMMGCKPISGTLTVVEPSTVKVVEVIVDDDVFCRIDPDNCTYTEVERDLTLKVGAMSAKLDLKSKKKIVLILNDLKNKPTVDFAIPADVKIPQRQGEFDITAAEVGQPYDIHGEVDTTVTESEEYKRWERCTYVERRRVCHSRPPRCRTNRRGQTTCDGGGQTCRYEDVTIWGEQRVEYFYRDTDNEIKVSLLSPGTQNRSAQFIGNRRVSEKIYTYKGICR